MRWLSLSVAIGILVQLIGCGVLSPAPAIMAACGNTGSSEQRARTLDQAALRADLQHLKIINYYPARNGWTYMWTRWNPEAINADFARIADAHATGVRVIVHPTVFGFPHPDPIQEQKLAYVIEAAEQHGLRVQLTLFDWWDDYADVDGSRQWATSILAPYRDDPRIAFVELQNEMDTSDPRAVAWARVMVPCVQEITTSRPVTISVSGTDGLPGLQRLVDAHLGLDFYDLHYYGKAAMAHNVFRQARSIVGSVPLRIGETGYATNAVAGEPLHSGGMRWQEAAQDQFFRTLEAAARACDLPPVSPWILSDFLPDAIPSTSSAANPAESAFGLLRADGTEKPAMRSIRSMFSGSPIDERFNNGFEDTADNGMPTNWEPWRPDLAQFARDTAVHHNGSASARISRSSSSPEAYPGFYLSPVRPIVASQSYTASAWVRGKEATGTTRISLAWFDANGTFLGNNSSSLLPKGTTDWVQLDVTAEAPREAVMVEIHLVSANNTGSVWFDDVTFD